jgi:hypothetical protein
MGGLDTSDVELPDDFVLQEIFEVELSASALADFTGRWGSLTGWGPARLSSLPYDWVSSQVRWQCESLDADVPEDCPRTTWMVPVSTVILHVQTLRIMASHLKVYFDGGSNSDFASAWLSHGYHSAPRNESQGWLWFDSLINTALSPYHAHVKSYPGGLLTGASPMPSLYQACGLQLYNYIAAATPFVHCANEQCGNLFTHRRGHAKYGQYKTSGVRYCTNSCAKAQAERERRRRRRGIASSTTSGYR